MPVFPSRSLTKPHARLHDLIVDVGFWVEDEFPVGKYTLDCYVAEIHAGIEYDGPMHEGSKAKRHDKERDRWLLEEAGIPVLRVRRGDNWQEVPDRIREFADQHGPTAEERRLRGTSWLP